MRIAPLLTTVCLLALAACQPTADEPNWMGMQVTTATVKGNISVVSGVGGNVLVIAGNEGTLLADTGITPLSSKLDAALADMHAAPVKTVIDTHYHFDHTGGNEHYGKQGAEIIAQRAVLARLSKPQHVVYFDKDLPALAKEGLPTTTFDKTYQLTAGEHCVVLVHPPKAAHTDGDAFVHVADANVIFTGDIYFNGFYPFIDYGVGGNIDGMIAATDAVLKASDNATVIIPGHGPLADKAALKAYRTMLASISKRVHALIAKGKTEDEAVAAKPTAEFDAAWGNGLFNGEQFTRIVYRGLKH